MPVIAAGPRVLLLAISIPVTAAVAADTSEPERPGPLPVPRATAPIRVDGVLDEAAWREALTLELPYQVYPEENTPAPVRTEVLLLYDEANLYAAFRAFDPEPSAIRARLCDRDAIDGDDWVGVVLDTFNDERRNYLFLVNPYGIQRDGMEITGYGGVSWDGIWESAARVTEWGWAAEIRVPFTSLALQRTRGPQVWGFDAIRGYPRSTFRQMGAFPRDRNNNCYLCQAIKIVGFDGVVLGRNLELDPTVTATTTRLRDQLPDGPLGDGHRDAEAGLTARWGITPNLALSGTLNPDFSQVEADAVQLDVNEPFALFFEEKRPFFMEAADFLRLAMDVVYTRTIRDPVWGVKLTGKEGGHTVAAYVVKDEVTNLLFPGPTGSDGTSLASGSLDAVARYKLDIGNRTTLGLIATDREGEDYANRLVGFDGDFRFTDTDRLRVLALASRTYYPDTVATEFAQPLGTFSDWAGEVVYSRDTRNFDWYVHLRHMGEGFRADQGFISRVGYRGGEVGASYDWLPGPGSWHSGMEIEAMVNSFDDPAGELLLRQAQAEFTVNLPLQSHVVVELTRSLEGYGGRLWDWNEVRFHGSVQPTAATGVWATVRVGDRIDYANGRLGSRKRFNGGLEQRLGPHLLLAADGAYEVMEVPGGRLYEAAVAQLTAAYQFTAECRLRAIVQGTHQELDPTLYVEEREPRQSRLASQLLLSYTLNPRTVLFVGYSDNRIGNQDFAPVVADRTVFVKLGYAWTL